MEITDINKIDELLNEARVCRLALFDGEYPYIVPMCFGYDLDGGKLELYFRCEEHGHKMELLKINNNAAFEIDELYGVTQSGASFDFEACYRSITGTGQVEFVTGIDKLAGLTHIMKKYIKNPSENKLSEQTVNSFAVLKLTAAEFCCKENFPERLPD